jgi:hypothetical protein
VFSARKISGRALPIADVDGEVSAQLLALWAGEELAIERVVELAPCGDDVAFEGEITLLDHAVLGVASHRDVATRKAGVDHRAELAPVEEEALELLGVLDDALFRGGCNVLRVAAGLQGRRPRARSAARGIPMSGWLVSCIRAPPPR